MRTIILLLFLLVAGCSHQPAMVLKTDYLKLQDSMHILSESHLKTLDSLQTLKSLTLTLNDSIEDLLVRPMMTSEQFIDLYRYYSLKKYYLICKKNPSQWKYYKGWSTQVFEQ